MGDVRGHEWDVYLNDPNIDDNNDDKNESEKIYKNYRLVPVDRAFMNTFQII